MASRTLHHASVRIRDLERSRRFYEGLLGLGAIARPEMGFPGAWYGVGGGEIHLIQRERVGGGIDPTDPHFALEVDDLAAVRRALDAAAIPYLAFGDGPLWVHDPDGNTIELRPRDEDT
jgi:catechol 2,3-dioxygenase-like lactoylglutathione lyase family enzyme